MIERISKGAFLGLFLLVVTMVSLGAFLTVLQIQELKKGNIDLDRIEYYIE